MVGGTEKISAADFFCFLPRLCRHPDPVSLQHMLPRRENFSSSECKMNTSEVRLVSSGWRRRGDFGFAASEAAKTKERHFVHSRRVVRSL